MALAKISPNWAKAQINHRYLVRQLKQTAIIKLLTERNFDKVDHAPWLASICNALFLSHSSLGAWFLILAFYVI
jgi:hypothetical protein